MCVQIYPYTYFNALNSKGLNSLSSFVVVSPALFSCSRIFFSTPVVRIGIRLGVLTGESDGGGVILLNWLCTEQKKILCSYIFNLDLQLFVKTFIILEQQALYALDISFGSSAFDNNFLKCFYLAHI